MSRIAILLPNLHVGGAERVNLDLAHAMARRGIEVEFVLMQARGDFLAEAQASFRVHDLNVRRGRHLPGPLMRYLRDTPPEALLAAMWPLTALAVISAKLARFNGMVAISEHSVLSAQYARWGLAVRAGLRVSTALGYRGAGARIAVSQGVADDMAGLALMRPEHFSVIHNPLRHLPKPSDAEMKAAEVLWAGAHPRILTVGNLKPAKDHPMLIRAFAALPEPKARLMIVGAGGRTAELRELAAEMGVAERVSLPGPCANPVPFYRTADLFALSSNREGFGNVIIEALACGLPVVSTDCATGPADILEGGRHGILSPVGDAAAFAKAMETALAQDWDKAQLQARAADFGGDTAAGRYLEALGLA